MIQVDLGWLYATVLLSLRLGPVVVMTPLMGAGYLPGFVKGIFALGLSAFLVLAMSWHFMVPDTVWGLLIAALMELLTGMLLAYSVHVAFGVLSFAGRLLDSQMGLGMAGMFDPLSRQTSALFGMILNLLAVAYVFAINGHYMVLQALVYSVEKLPLGQMVRGLDMAMITAQFGLVFSLGLLLVAPIIFMLFFVEVGIALMARSMPQFNAFLVSIPAKIAIGLGLMMMFIPFLGGGLERWFRSILQFWDVVLF